MADKKKDEPLASGDYAAGFAAGIEEGRKTGGDHVTNEPPPLTLDAVRKMSQTEINERWDEVVKVLEGK